ncbi:hypothetical protein Q0F98_36125 [Paenibacillus amylolyticus]|nr:hypothetical protein Q0F98_36125 [Paenibacillus amylolyticus]
MADIGVIIANTRVMAAIEVRFFRVNLIFSCLVYELGISVVVLQ